MAAEAGELPRLSTTFEPSIFVSVGGAARRETTRAAVAIVTVRVHALPRKSRNRL